MSFFWLVGWLFIGHTTSMRRLKNRQAHMRDYRRGLGGAIPSHGL
jgi:hypothetical protein